MCAHQCDSLRKLLYQLCSPSKKKIKKCKIIHLAYLEKNTVETNFASNIIYWTIGVDAGLLDTWVLLLSPIIILMIVLCIHCLKPTWFGRHVKPLAPKLPLIILAKFLIGYQF